MHTRTSKHTNNNSGVRLNPQPQVPRPAQPGFLSGDRPSVRPEQKFPPPADTKLTGRGLGRLGLLVLLLGRLGLGLAAHCYWRCGMFVWESGAWVSVLFTAAIIECDELVQIALAKDADPA